MSQFKVNGVVDKAWTKVKNTRAGDKTIHYASVDGNEFSTGFNAVFQQGEFANVVVEYKYGEYQLVPNLSPSNQPDLGSQPPPAPAKKAWGGGSTGGGFTKKSSTFPIDPKDGQMAIIRQNSMNRAVEILDSWMTPYVEGMDPLWTPKDQKEYIQKLHEVALTITDFNSGQDITNVLNNNLRAVNQ